MFNSRNREAKTFFNKVQDIEIMDILWYNEIDP